MFCAESQPFLIRKRSGAKKVVRGTQPRLLRADKPSVRSAICFYDTEDVMAEVSKVTGDRLSVSGAVVAAIEVQGQVIADKAEDVLRLRKKVDLNVFVAELGKVLRGAENDLRITDAAYLAELTDDADVRAERDAADAGLREALVGARSMVVGAYGATFASSVGLGANLERRSDLLVAQAQNASKLLRGKRAPSAKIGKLKLPLAAIADSIDEASSALSHALTAVERERREAQTAMIARNHAASRWERIYGAVAEIVVGLASVAGEDELALRIRPTARKRAGIVEAPETTPPETTEDETPASAADPEESSAGES
jgi:hypothetical protein